MKITKEERDTMFEELIDRDMGDGELEALKRNVKNLQKLNATLLCALKLKGIFNSEDVRIIISGAKEWW